MKVMVLGAGVIGVATAYYLAKAGLEVTVIERQHGVALETSFANAGEISPGYSAPWAGPGVPLKAVRWLLMQHRPLVVRTVLDPAMWIWGARMLRNCTAARYELNKGRMLRLATYSRDCLQALRAETGIRYDDRSQGTLQLFRTMRQLDGAAKDISVLRRFGVPYELLDQRGCVAAEPALTRVREKFVGGLRLPGDETGDCHKFSRELARHAEDLGANFVFGTRIRKIIPAGGRVDCICTDAGDMRADAYIVCLASYSTLLMRPLQIRLPVYPVKGYSITVPITLAAAAPESTIMDETFKVAVTRLGDRIRVGGTAELAGYDLKLHAARRDTLDHVVSDLFPEAGDLGRAEFWTGLRPMTPDGTPIVGATTLKNLFLNTGHGTLGWTMATGSGQVLADLVSGRVPEIDLQGLTLARYAGSSFTG